MRKGILVTTILALFLLSVGMVSAVGEVAVICNLGASVPTSGTTIGEDSEENASIALSVNCDNAAITVSTMSIAISPAYNGVSSVTLTPGSHNSTNTSYYEYSISGLPEESYTFTPTTTFVNTTNSTSFVDSDDTLNLTVLSSTGTAQTVIVELNEGSNAAQRQATTATGEKKGGIDNLSIIVIVLLSAVAVFFAFKEKK